MTKLSKKLALLAVVLGTGVAQATPIPKLSSLSPSDQWMPYRNGDPRATWGYNDALGELLLADELGDHLSELGRASLVERCIHGGSDALATWALCGSDAKRFDPAKLAAELDADGWKPADKADVIKRATEAHEAAMEIGAPFEAAAKTDKGIQQVMKIVEDAKAEWAAYLAKHADEYAHYLAYRDAVRTGKSDDPAFAGCYEATKGPFEKLVKATAPKIPWDVGNDQLPGYMSYLTATTEGYITSVAWAACAWSVDPAGEAVYVAAANSFAGHVRAGWRTLALAHLIDSDLSIKFADRSLSIGGWARHMRDQHVDLKGINNIAAITTPIMGQIGKLTPKDDQILVHFKADQVESCLEWQTTNRVKSVNNGNVEYEKVCKKRGKVDNDEGTVPVPAKYVSKGTKIGDYLTIIASFPVVSWKGKKITAILGVATP